jgi:hypothetical protein
MPKIEFEKPLKNDIEIKGEPRPRRRRETFLQVVERHRREETLHHMPVSPFLDSKEFKERWTEIIRERNRKAALCELDAMKLVITD